MANLTIPSLIALAEKAYSVWDVITGDPHHTLRGDSYPSALKKFFDALLSLEEWNSSQEEFLEFLDAKSFSEEGLTVQQVYKLGGSTSGPLERVYRVHHGDVRWFFAMYGSYDSYGGYDFETVKLVHPYTFTETRYK